MKKIFLFLALLLSISCVSHAQSIDKISHVCPSPNQSSFGSVAIVNNDVTLTPCPTGTVNISGISTITGSGTANFIPRWTSASNLSTTPFSWNGTIYNFQNTGLNNTFLFRFTPTLGSGLFEFGNNTSAAISLSENAKTGSFFADSGLTLSTAGSHVLSLNDNQTAGITINGGGAGTVLIGDIATFNDLISVDSSLHTIQVSGLSSTVLGTSPSGITITSGTDALTTSLSTWNLNGVTTFNLQRTVTAGGTTGAQTINKPNGSVNIAAGGSSIVVTNSTVTTSSLINAVVNTNDATCSVKNAVPTANTITITMTANCTAETRVAFWVWN